MGIGGAKEGVIEYSDEFKFLEDKRTFKIKMYGMGRAYDNTVSVLLATLNYQFKLPFEMEVLIKDNLKCTHDFGHNNSLNPPVYGHRTIRNP